MTEDKKIIELSNIIDKELRKRINIDDEYIKNILESIEYSLFTGGKRIRPILALKSYNIFSNKDNYDEIIPFAIAIEMIHTYSLIHDDLPSMDNDDMRRGKPSNHKVYGEALAILAGDALLNLAFETIIDSFIGLKDNYEYEKRSKAAKSISEYSGLLGMVGGQVVDLYPEKNEISEDELLYMYKSKTAALIQSATVSGSIIGGANKEEIEIMEKFGYYLGMAYQIKDDILDQEEDEEINKITYLSHYGIEKTKKDLKSFSDKAKIQLEFLKNRNTVYLLKLTDELTDREV